MDSGLWTQIKYGNRLQIRILENNGRGGCLWLHSSTSFEGTFASMEFVHMDPHALNGAHLFGAKTT